MYNVQSADYRFQLFPQLVTMHQNVIFPWKKSKFSENTPLTPSSLPPKRNRGYVPAVAVVILSFAGFTGTDALQLIKTGTFCFAVRLHAPFVKPFLNFVTTNMTRMTMSMHQSHLYHLLIHRLTGYDCDCRWQQRQLNRSRHR